MRIFMFITLLTAFLCISCETNPESMSAPKKGFGDAEFTISLMQPGTLAKKTLSTPELMIVRLSASGEEEIVDTIELESDYSQITTVSFESLTAPLDWTIAVEVTDQNDKVTHAGSLEFSVTPGFTTREEMALPASFSNLRVIIPELEHPINYGELWIDDSCRVTKPGSDPMEISYDYLSTNTLHSIELKLFSVIGEDTVAYYLGSTEVEPEPGKNRQLTMVLHYIGPTSGSADITIGIGEIGEIVITATTETETDYALHFTTGTVAVAASEDNRITGSLSISAWVRIEENPTGFGSIVCKWDDLSGAQQRSFALTLMRDRGVRFDVDANGSWGTGDYWSGEPDNPVISSASGNALMISQTKVSPSAWTHVAGVFDAENQLMSLYINGELECAVATEFSSILDTDEPILIGAGDLGEQGRQYLNGDLDEISIWNRPLTSDEIATLAQGTPLSGEESGLKGYWNCNEGSGETIFDPSPYQNNGIFIDNGGSIPEWITH